MRMVRAVTTALAIGLCVGVAGKAQETQIPEQHASQSELKHAIRWKSFAYTCEGGAKVSVNIGVGVPLARVFFQNRQYVLKQTASADGDRYSDGKVLWWGKGERGFLQEDTADGKGKFLAKDCKLDKPASAFAGVNGTISYQEKVALLPEAVVDVQLWELPSADAKKATELVAEEKMILGNRQVPVAYGLKFDAAKIHANRTYGLTVRILVDNKVRFSNGQGYVVIPQRILIGGNPSLVDVILQQAGTDEGEKP